MSCVIATKLGWHEGAGRVKHVVDLHLTVTRTGPHDNGVGRAADAPGGPKVGEHTPEGITTKDNSCGEALRQKAEGAGNGPYIAEIPFVDFDMEASRERVRRRASGSAVPTAAAERTRAPTKRRERSAKMKKKKVPVSAH